MVLNDPLHKMYGKVNRYLQRRPSWEVEKIPSYWIDQILLHPPEDDDGHSEEVNWLLDMLVKGLRTPQVSDCKVVFFHSLVAILTTATGLGHLPSCKRLRTYIVVVQRAEIRAKEEDPTPRF